jgi:hypothetical protein
MGAVDVAVARDQDDVEALPATFADFYRGCGEKHG